MTLPDLRPEMKQVELEHCSVLIEMMRNTLLMSYDGDPEEFVQICNMIDPLWMRKDLKTMFTDQAFQNLFKTEVGKGILIGAFAQRMFTTETVEEST